MSGKTIRRVLWGALAAGLALGPLALVAGAQEPEPFELNSDPPGDFGEFTPNLDGLPDDALLETFWGGTDPQAVIAALSQGAPDTDGDGLPDEGDPGLYDLRPAEDFFSGLLTENVGDSVAASGATTEVSIGGSSKLQGQCAGAAISYDADGNVIDAAYGIGGAGNGLLVDAHGGDAGSRAFTEGNPFEVRADGLVVYYGYLPFTGGDGPLDHRWEIVTAGISLDSGGDPNPQLKNRNAGVADLGDNIPAAARFTGTFPVSGEMFAKNGQFCLAEGWVHFGGPFPLFTTPGAIATLLAGGGLLGLIFNSRPAYTWRG